MFNLNYTYANYTRIESEIKKTLKHRWLKNIGRQNIMSLIHQRIETIKLKPKKSLPNQNTKKTYICQLNFNKTCNTVYKQRILVSTI